MGAAARLRSKAPVGCVFVGAETFAESRERFEFVALEPMALKGKKRPVPVYDLVGERRGALAVACGWGLAEPAAHTALAGGPSGRRFSRWYTHGIADWIAGRLKTVRPLAQ